MTTKTTNIPDWLEAAINKYHIVPASDVKNIFEVFFAENVEENTVDSPRFRKLSERLVRLKKLKKAFVTKLEAAGYFDSDDGETSVEVDDEDFEDDEEFEDVDEDAEFEDDEDDDSVEYEDDEEDEDSEEEFEDDEEELEEEEDIEDEEDLDEDDEDDEDEEELEEEFDEEEEVTDDEESVPTRSRKSKSSYEETGIPTLDEVTAFVGDGYNHTQEFENPVHLDIAVKALTELGFDLEYDSRVDGGTIKRPRGGKYILKISVNNKRGVKRRGKVAPVFAFVEQITNEFDSEAENLVESLVQKHIGSED